MAARMTKADEQYSIGLSRGYDRGEEAGRQASQAQMEGLQETVRELLAQNRDLFTVIQRMVNGASRTMGTDSCGEEYAHIRQAILDIGREALRDTGRRVHAR